METKIVVKKLRRKLDESLDYSEFCQKRFKETELEIVELRELIDYLENL